MRPPGPSAADDHAMPAPVCDHQRTSPDVAFSAKNLLFQSPAYTVSASADSVGGERNAWPPL